MTEDPHQEQQSSPYRIGKALFGRTYAKIKPHAMQHAKEEAISDAEKECENAYDETPNVHKCKLGVHDQAEREG